MNLLWQLTREFATENQSETRQMGKGTGSGGSGSKGGGSSSSGGSGSKGGGSGNTQAAADNRSNQMQFRVLLVTRARVNHGLNKNQIVRVCDATTLLLLIKIQGVARRAVKQRSIVVK
ncbi:hypothetical protein GN244_ATG05324 [Phytophthora infestans]|uniref:Uncharacterized protein n=1 Tax=Phytophthora infestans TaxID=4787 RepID=A0A833T2S1_PHYIN|nr:hypothetical protein GN244_ATG05324 [Phytophthora infestans]